MYSFMCGENNFILQRIKKKNLRQVLTNRVITIGYCNIALIKYNNTNAGNTEYIHLYKLNP